MAGMGTQATQHKAIRELFSELWQEPLVFHSPLIQGTGSFNERTTDFVGFWRHWRGRTRLPVAGLAPETASDSVSSAERDSGRADTRMARPAGNVRPSVDAIGVIGSGADPV